MDEPRTKLVCNLGLADFFTYPGEEGTWRRTPTTTKLSGKKYYTCRQLENYKKMLVLPGNERVELKEKYTERVSSRLLDTHTGLVLPFLGKDIRLLRS